MLSHPYKRAGEPFKKKENVYNFNYGVCRQCVGNNLS